MWYVLLWSVAATIGAHIVSVCVIVVVITQRHSPQSTHLSRHNIVVKVSNCTTEDERGHVLIAFVGRKPKNPFHQVELDMMRQHWSFHLRAIVAYCCILWATNIIDNTSSQLDYRESEHVHIVGSLSLCIPRVSSMRQIYTQTFWTTHGFEDSYVPMWCPTSSD